MLPDASRDTALHQQETIKKLEKRWRIRQPTEDKLVMLRLRELTEPIMLFGETPEERRERLRDTLATFGSDEGFPRCVEKKREEPVAPRGLYYTTGSDELLAARRGALADSMLRARRRVDTLGQGPDAQPEEAYRGVRLVGSVVADDARLLRVTACCNVVLTGGQSGTARLWGAANCECQHEFAVGASIHALAFSPLYPDGPLAFGAGADDGAVRLYSPAQPQPLTLRGHVERVNTLEFHPSGRFLMTGGHDWNIRVWDLENGAPLLAQTGHAGAVRVARWHVDGGVMMSAGEDRDVRLWDFRLGKGISVLRGHTARVLDADWHRGGGVLATASGDNTVRLWDIRMQRCAVVIPAHTDEVTSVRFDASGEYLLTGGFDRVVRVWSVKDWDWKMVAELKNHAKAVSSVAWCEDGRSFVSSSFDRTWKLWSCD